MDPTRPFENCYEDDRRAESYAKLGFERTYHLAYRDLPELIARHVQGRRALDFGCGTGRSTRFLQGLGFTVTGVDIAEEMVRRARAADPAGDYRLVPGDDLGAFPDGAFDLVLCAFTFDNVPTFDTKAALFAGLRRLLSATGRIVTVVSSPRIYVHEWASFSTAAFPENRTARSGDVVRIVGTDVEDARPVEDVLWTDESYREVYAAAGLEVLAVHEPLGRPDDGPWTWVSETGLAPWVLWVLGRTPAALE